MCYVYTFHAGNVQRCRTGQFQCSVDMKCIPDYWRCDNERDCLDGTDENECQQIRSICFDPIGLCIYVPFRSCGHLKLYECDKWCLTQTNKGPQLFYKLLIKMRKLMQIRIWILLQEKCLLSPMLFFTFKKIFRGLHICFNTICTVVFLGIKYSWEGGDSTT